MNNILVSTRIGKFPFLIGKQFFNELTKAKHSEKLLGIITYPMKQSGVLFGQLVKQNKRGKCYSLSNGCAELNSRHFKPENTTLTSAVGLPPHDGLTRSLASLC